jgi:hypothetical protein
VSDDEPINWRVYWKRTLRRQRATSVLQVVVFVVTVGSVWSLSSQWMYAWPVYAAVYVVASALVGLGCGLVVSVAVGRIVGRFIRRVWPETPDG